MGVFSSQAPNVGFQAASSVREPESFSAINNGLAMLGEHAKNADASAAADANAAAKSAGANLFIDQAIASDKLDMQTDQSIGFAGLDANERANAVSQGKMSKQLSRVHNLLAVKNAINDYGYSALEGFKGASGEGLADTNKGMYISQSEESKAVEKQQADVDAYLKSRSIFIEGMSPVEKEMAMQTDVIRQRTLLNATETASLNTKNSENFYNENVGLVSANISGGFSNVLDNLAATTDKATQQQKLNNIMGMDSFTFLKQAGYPQNIINNFMKVDANVSGKFTASFNAIKSATIEAAKEIMTNGTTSTATQNKLNILKNEKSVLAMDVAEKMFGSKDAAAFMSSSFGDAVLKDASFLNLLSTAAQKLIKGDLGNNVDEIVAASDFVTRATEENGNVTPAGRDAISRLSKAISFKVETGDVYEQTKALNSISPQVIQLLSPADKNTVVKKVTARIEETRAAMFAEFEKQGVEGKSLSDLYSIHQSRKTGALWMTPKPNVDIPPELNNSVLNTSFKGLIEASIKARTVTNGGDEAEAIEFVTGKAVEKAPPKVETKTSGLDTEGLSEPDMMDIQSYILELKAKAHRESSKGTIA